MLGKLLTPEYLSRNEFRCHLSIRLHRLLLKKLRATLVESISDIRRGLVFVILPILEVHFPLLQLNLIDPAYY